MTEWFCKVMGEEKGPFSAEQLRAMAARGELLPDSFVKRGENSEWVLAERVKGLFVPQAVAEAKPGLAAEKTAQTPAAHPGSAVREERQAKERSQREHAPRTAGGGLDADGQAGWEKVHSGLNLLYVGALVLAGSLLIAAIAILGEIGAAHPQFGVFLALVSVAALLFAMRLENRLLFSIGMGATAFTCLSAWLLQASPEAGAALLLGVVSLAGLACLAGALMTVLGLLQCTSAPRETGIRWLAIATLACLAVAVPLNTTGAVMVNNAGNLAVPASAAMQMLWLGSLFSAVSPVLIGVILNKVAAKFGDEQIRDAVNVYLAVATTLSLTSGIVAVLGLTGTLTYFLKHAGPGILFWVELAMMLSLGCAAFQMVLYIRAVAAARDSIDI